LGYNKLKRASRRHHRQRLMRKHLREGYWYFDREAPHEGHLQASVDTPKNCSCSGCGNARRHLGEVTLQERKAEDSTQEQLIEVQGTDITRILLGVYDGV
jgi:hypothetical protein